MQRKRIIEILLFIFYFIHLSTCCYDLYDNTTYSDNDEKLRIPSADFKITPLTKEDLPNRFVASLKGHGVQLSLLFTKVQGVVNNVASNSFIYFADKNGLKKQAINKTIIYAEYRSDDRRARGILIRNTDLLQMGVRVTSPYRLILTAFINGVQFDSVPGLFRLPSGKPTFHQMFYKTKQKKGTFDDDINEQSKSTTRSSRVGKRQTTGSTAKNFFVEYLIVLDSSMYNKYQKIYSLLSPSMVYDYLNIHFTHFVNAMDYRYQNAFSTNTIFKINIRLSNILVFTNTADTPWTIQSLVGVAGIPKWNTRDVVVTTLALAQFRDYMNARTFPFNYDHAVAIMDKDLWSSSTTLSNYTRSLSLGYSINGGICSLNKYSVVEDMGYLDVWTSAHELGHNLGAPHDGSGASAACPASDNFMMTPSIGTYTNFANSLKFSSCSLTIFQNALLAADLVTLTATGQCLANLPGSNNLTVYFGTDYLPGTFYTPDAQCKMWMGPTSARAPCTYIIESICQSLWCTDLSGGCTAFTGLAALDGTTCGTNMMCFKGSCVPLGTAKTLVSNPCSIIGQCINGGTCVPVSNMYLCSCPVNFWGQRCEFTNGTTVITTTSTTTKTSTTTTTVKAITKKNQGKRKRRGAWLFSKLF